MSANMNEKLELLQTKYPNHWIEMEYNSIARKWLARVSTYPSYSHLQDHILLEVGNSLEEAVDKLLC